MSNYNRLCQMTTNLVLLLATGDKYYYVEQYHYFRPVQIT